MIRKPATLAFWHGRLPHWEVEEGRYFVTLHLAGAIPFLGQERIRALSQELEKLARHDRAGRLKLQRQIFKEMEDWLDRAEHVTHLQQQAVAEMVMQAIRFREGRTWQVFEYVVMPNHLHLFFQILDGHLKSLLEGFKRWTGHEASKLIALNGQGFWQDEWFDHWSRSDEEDDRIVCYIRQNPEKAGLVKNYLDWPYGSWRRR